MAEIRADREAVAGTTQQDRGDLLPADPVRRKQAMGGIFLLALAAVCGYFFMYQPVHTAVQTNGELHYYLKGIMLPPLCLYMAALALTGKVRDGELRALNAKGQPTLTRKGWWVVAGAVTVIGLTFAVWYAYLHALGFREMN